VDYTDYTGFHTTRNVFQEVAANMQAIAAHPEYLASVDAATTMLVDAMRAGRKLLVFGNGGSATDAEHIAAEFVCRFAMTRAALPAIALTTNNALLTATSNDLSFDEVFVRQIDALGQQDDVAWGISTSGRSPNVVKALARARERGLKTIGLCGAQDTPLTQSCDVLMAVPLTVTARIQEVHLVTAHIICGAVESRLFPAT
jgi:D-sedoheptulose 7-phosphate isomerase